jgi:hypothetical protein
MSLLLSIGLAWIIKEACVASGMSVLGWSIFAAPFVFVLVQRWYKKVIVFVLLGVVAYLETRVGHTLAGIMAIGSVILMITVRPREKQTQSHLPTFLEAPSKPPQGEAPLEDLYQPVPAKGRVLN